ncbi:cilia- and flagella-associated protein 337-like [Gastrophryne carolinensis]
MEESESHQHYPQQQQQHKKSHFHLPAIVVDTPHREPFVQISPMPDNKLLAIGQDGLLTVWSPDLKLKKSRCVLDENKQQNRKLKWILNSMLMPEYNKLIVGTCDREIRFYELSNFEPYCQIVGFETMPLHLGYRPRETDECLIYFGDEQGCVNIIIISHMAETLRNWTKCQVVDDIPSIAITNIPELSRSKFIRWKVHNDWVTQIRYVHSIESLISSSNDDYTALIIGCVEGSKSLQKRMKDLMESSSVKGKRPMLAGNVPPKRNLSDESHFKVKRGVKTFDFSKEANVLVTGGMDRIVRVWNPYVPGWPTGVLRGHSSPITHLQIAHENTKIYSVSTDCTVMVWDIESHTCLISVISKASQIKGEIAACYFSESFRALYIATDNLAALPLQESCYNGTIHGLPSVSHNEPITSCLYNHLHQQIISCTEASVMKVWHLLSGRLIGEVQAAHGHSAITCLALDSLGNRLVTGSRDGTLKQWDWTPDSITFLKIVRQGGAGHSKDGISDITFAEHNNSRYIVVITCDARIIIFPDHCVVFSGYEYPQPSMEIKMSSIQEEGRFSLGASSSDLMAASNLGGEVCVWSLGTGEVLFHLKASEGEEPDGATDDLNINKVIFIRSRIERQNDAAILIASGPKGIITFWNIVGGGRVYARLAGSHYKSVISEMAISEDDSILCTADHNFYVYIWNISEYALTGPEEKPPVLLHCWRAHQCEITRVIPVMKHNVIVTSSLDCTVKLWSLKGESIGTFGQYKSWCIKNMKGQNETTNNDFIFQKQASYVLCESKEEQLSSSLEVDASFIVTEEIDVAKALKEINTQTSNRLKTISLKHLEFEFCGRPNSYKSLQICDLTSVPATIQKPNPRAELNDPYDLAF